MSDIQITKSGSEHELVQVEGQSDAGDNFIDGYATGEFQVVDSGRIIIRRDDLAEFTRQAVKAGLTVEAE